MPMYTQGWKLWRGLAAGRARPHLHITTRDDFVDADIKHGFKHAECPAGLRIVAAVEYAVAGVEHQYSGFGSE